MECQRLKKVLVLVLFYSLTKTVVYVTASDPLRKLVSFSLSQWNICQRILSKWHLGRFDCPRSIFCCVSVRDLVKYLSCSLIFIVQVKIKYFFKILAIFVPFKFYEKIFVLVNIGNVPVEKIPKTGVPVRISSLTVSFRLGVFIRERKQ